jgi:hypothetical protein
MSDMLGISSNAIGAYQRALSTVSNNIANVNTEGYSRQDVVLKDSAPTKAANNFFGTGVALDAVKRQFDAFAESNLRSSTSDLSSQKPMVDYTKRVMDIMGDKSVGLSSALDDFFAAANALSADPASTVLRSTFLRSADGLSSRFGELSGQLSLVGTETTQALESTATQINTLTDQIALVNQHMANSATLEGQPAELLDRRDLLLRKLSDLVRIKTSFTTNGTVNVALGNTATQSVVVNGQKSRPIGVDKSTPGKTDLVLDPYGTTESLASASGGQLGGLQTFIAQVLQPAQKNLNALAVTFASEANRIQRNGIDGYGQMGQDLFSFAPGVADEAAGIRLAVNDGMRVATAAQFRVAEAGSNTTATRASVQFSGTTPATALSNPAMVNNPNPSAGVTFKVDGGHDYLPVTSLSAGVNATFYLDQADPGQQLQVLTRDGRQLLGQALSETEKYQLFTPQNGFASNAIYSDKYLNKSGAQAYRDLDMFYGAKASVSYGQTLDGTGQNNHSLPLAAVLESSRINATDFSMAAGAMNLNGLALPKLVRDPATHITISNLKLADPTIPDAQPDFHFSAVVGGKAISVLVPASDALDLVSLRNSLQASLIAKGLDVNLIHSGQDVSITDSQGRDISGVSLTPITTATYASPSMGAGAYAGFASFSATIGGVAYHVKDLQSTTLSDLALEIQNGLRGQDKLSGLSVVLDGADLKISDAQGRSLQNLSLIPTDLASGANDGTLTVNDSAAAAGQVSVSSSASQVASWLNGVSKASITGINFGTSVDDSFSQFNATIGGLDFKVPLLGLSSNSLDAVALQIQTAMRQQDRSSNISVEVNGNSLNIQDAAGREFKNFALIPSDGVDATGGSATLTNSQVSQTHVRADVFSEIRIPVVQLDLTKPLTLNGQSITGYRTMNQLVDAINRSPAGLSASLSPGGELVIEDLQGGSVSVGAAPDGNAINVRPGTYSAQVRMVQEVRDLTVPTAGMDVTKPLQINGVNLNESAYDIPADPFGAYSVEFGYPTQSVSANNAAALAAALNSRASLSGVTFPVSGDVVAFSSFAISLDGKPIEFKDLTSTTLPNLAQELQDRLQAADGQNPDLTVTVNDAGTGLIFSDAQGRNLVPAGLTLSDAGFAAQASKGKVDDVLSQTYRASVRVNAAGQDQLVISSVRGDLSDADLANAFVVKSADTVQTPQTSITTLQGLIDRINSQNSSTGVAASLDANGNFKLTATDAKGTRNISVGPGKLSNGLYATNALGLEPLDYSVTQRLQNLLQLQPTMNDIRLSFGSYTDGTPPVTRFGDPSQMGKIGFRTGAYLEGGSPDDLLVFVTGKGSANVASSFSGQPLNVRDSLRTQSLMVKFTEADRYSIIDSKTGTELADRHYDPNSLEPVVEFQGLTLKFSHAPAVGDSFAVDGNFDGLGNNVNMLDMADLSKKNISNGKTIGNNYIDQINNVGNLAQQANMTQQALTVVNDQAVAARDKVSGVNLDEEAAALIRYQQAYQASAKALQVSGQLFDAIAQIR